MENKNLIPRYVEVADLTGEELNTITNDNISLINGKLVKMLTEIKDQLDADGDLIVDGPFVSEEITTMPAGYVPYEEFERMTTIEECSEESIQQRCEELQMEVEEENNVIGIVCYVGDLTEQLINAYNCNIKELKLFNKYLITNLGMEVYDITVNPEEMDTINDILLDFSIDDEAFSMTVGELKDLGLVTWIDSIEHPVEMSGLEFRALTKLCTANEITSRY